MAEKNLELLCFAHHPIQYQTPIFRILASKMGSGFHVHFKDGTMGQGAVDPGFGVQVTWDTDVLGGYSHSFHGNNEQDNSLLEILKAYRPQAVLMFLGYNDSWAVSVLALCQLLGIPVLWRFEGSDSGQRNFLKSQSRDLFLRLIYRGVDAFLSIGKNCTQHLLRLGVSEKRIFPSPYNIDDVLFEKMAAEHRSNRLTIRRELGFQEDDFVFIFCGKLIPRKDPLLILEALEKCPSRVKAAVIFVGTGELMPQVTQRARALLGSKAILPGFANQTEMGRFYAAADAAILPSLRETWGLVVNEAMVCGLPVIVSDGVESHFDLISENQTGFVFPVGNAESLAQKIEYFIAHRDAATRMGQQAYARIQRYSTQAAAEGVLNAFSAVRLARRAA